MPQDLYLKSFGFATSISVPGKGFRVARTSNGHASRFRAHHLVEGISKVSAATLAQRYFAGRSDGLRPPNNAQELRVATA
jgi:hypothetical protein